MLQNIQPHKCARGARCLGSGRNTETGEIWGSKKMGGLCWRGGNPEIIAPIQVEVEKTKSRLINNAQYLNCFMHPPSFNMDGVGKIAEIGWDGMFMISIDHKHGYFHKSQGFPSIPGI